MNYLFIVVIGAVVGFIAGQYLKGSEHGAGIDVAAGAARSFDGPYDRVHFGFRSRVEKRLRRGIRRDHDGRSVGCAPGQAKTGVVTVGLLAPT